MRFEITDDMLPGVEARVQELASKDPAACAQYFIEVAEYVITELLGYDSKKHTSKPGLLGEIEWFGGGIENQGSQLLHYHKCIRFRRFPKWLNAMHVVDDESSMRDDTTSEPPRKEALSHKGKVLKCKKRSELC